MRLHSASGDVHPDRARAPRGATPGHGPGKASFTDLAGSGTACVQSEAGTACRTPAVHLDVLAEATEALETSDVSSRGDN